MKKKIESSPTVSQNLHVAGSTIDWIDLVHKEEKLRNSEEMQAQYRLMESDQSAVDWIDFTYDHHNSETAVSNEYLKEMTELAAQVFLKDGEKGLRKIRFFDTYFEQLDTQSRSENFGKSG